MFPANHPDHTWASMMAELPPAERELRFVLPYRIGITWRPDGGWGDYVRFEALYDLVGYLADAVDDVDEEQLARFRRAHHCAGYYLLVIDRIADGQVVEDAALAADREWLREQLLDALATACGSRALAVATVENAEERWRMAVDAENAAFAAGELHPADYAEIVYGKVAPLWVAGEGLIRLRGTSPPQRSSLQRSFNLMLLSLQLNDDAVDAPEDLRTPRGSAPELLAMQRTSLGISAKRLLDWLSGDLEATQPRWAAACRTMRDDLPNLRLDCDSLPLAALGAEVLLAGTRFWERPNDQTLCTP